MYVRTYDDFLVWHKNLCVTLPDTKKHEKSFQLVVCKLNWWVVTQWAIMFLKLTVVECHCCSWWYPYLNWYQLELISKVEMGTLSITIIEQFNVCFCILVFIFRNQKPTQWSKTRTSLSPTQRANGNVLIS